METSKQNVPVKSVFSGHTRTKDKIMSIKHSSRDLEWIHLHRPRCNLIWTRLLRNVHCTTSSTFSSAWLKETAAEHWITSQWIEIFLWLVKPESNSHLLTAWWMTSVLTYAECPKGRVLSLPSTTWDGGHCTVNSWGPLFSACLGEH